MLLEEIGNLQSELSRGEININAPCGAEPIIKLLGGIAARAAIHETFRRYPTVREEFELVTRLIALLTKHE